MKVFLMRYLFVMNLLVAVYGQDTGTLSGVILDHKSKEPLIGANVIVEGTSLGAATDYEGKYLIQGVDVGIISLKVTYIGYEVKNITNVEIVLKSIW